MGLAERLGQYIKVPHNLSDLLLDRSQFLVFAGLSNVLIMFLTLVVLFGMWSLSVSGSALTVGITVFCASFSFSDIAKCSFLDGQLECPFNFQGPTCVSWYELPKFGEDITLAVFLQVLSVLGILSSICSASLNMYIWIRVLEANQFNKFVQYSAILNCANAILSLCSFLVYSAIPYVKHVERGQGCVYLYGAGGKIECVNASTLNPQMASSYAYSVDVAIFCISALTCLFHSGFIFQKQRQKRDKAQ